MSADFWWGMFCIPAVIVAIVIGAVAITWFIWVSSNWGVDEYKLWPKSMQHDDRVVLVSTVALARWAGYLWIPGWHVVICRTSKYQAKTDQQRERHRKVQWAVREVSA